jgi:hypothetical protein
LSGELHVGLMAEDHGQSLSQDCMVIDHDDANWTGH